MNSTVKWEDKEGAIKKINTKMTLSEIESGGYQLKMHSLYSR